MRPLVMSVWLCRRLPHYVIANSQATLATLHLGRQERCAAIYSGIDLGPTETDTLAEASAGALSEPKAEAPRGSEGGGDWVG